MSEITTKEAFLAMFSFLEKHYELTKSDDIAALLGSMSLLEEGVTADPAMWEEWQESIKRVKLKEVNAELALNQNS